MTSDPMQDQTLHDRVLAELHSALDAAHALGLFSLDLGELERFTCEALRVAERARALAAAAVAEADHARLAPRSGIASLTAHLAAKTKSPTAAVAPCRTIGLWLDAFPEFAHAWADGHLSEAHIRELKHLDGPRTRTLLVRDQHVHVEAARTLCFDDWLKTLSYWLLHADPDGTLTPERVASYGIKTRLERNGDVHVHALLDPITGEAFLTVVEHETEKLFRKEVDAGHEHGAITHRARQSIALMRLLKRGYQRADGTFPLPLINLVMSQQVAEDLINRTAETDGYDPHHLPLDWKHIDQRCETIRGTPIDPRRTLPALLIGRLRRQVLNSKGRTIDLGHDTRLFTPTQKNALLVESRGSCSTPGCDAPWAWLTADHITPHSHGGLTTLTNGQTLCDPDNHRKGDNRAQP